MTTTSLLPHDIRREDRHDGTILLSSGYPMPVHAAVTGDWLHTWATDSPERIFIAERSGPGWREVTFAETLDMVSALAASLAARGLGPEAPIMVISGNGVDHGLLTLAAQYVGIPIVPVAEQYSLIVGAEDRLRHAVGLTGPGMVYCSDATAYARALSLPDFENVEIVASTNAAPGMTQFDTLLRGNLAVDVGAAHARVRPDTVAKILLTSGSTSTPKGVITTHRMLCANQAQLAAVFPVLTSKPLRIVDWLPWNHVFGGSHNFNMMLANGGSLYIDDGKPTRAGIDRTIENLRLTSGNLWFNVPVGFAMLAEAMKSDQALRTSVFSDLEMIFYAGASLPQETWDAIEQMALEVRGEAPTMTGSWGLTETAPSTLVQHEETTTSGVVGAPLPGVTVKLIPREGSRYEIRVKGPNVMPGYLGDAVKTAEAFDAEGFLMTGDVMRFVDAAQINKGLRFDGRISEDFKLLSGTWVRAASLRLEVLGLLEGIAADLVVTGAGRSEVGVLIFPDQVALNSFETAERDGAIVCKALAEEIVRRLSGRAAGGSASRISRALVMSEPPSASDSEITAKGNLNVRRVLDRRGRLLARLYNDADLATVIL